MNENIVAKILFNIGVAEIAVGIITGLILGNQDPYSVMNWSLFLAWAIGGFIGGMLLIGFSEVIRLLHTINQKISPVKSDEILNKPSNETGIADKSVSWVLDDADKEKIRKAYQNETIVEMIPSPMEGYCLVELKGSQGYYVKVVDIAGFGAEEIQDPEIKHKIIKWYNDKDN
ncbi:hypothetical protein [Virgibacillus doumboii]|uniref:hypothetical protein n=1 Tax=Virgibacillus doumboii TaxID=2697503 RepID=UPI0013DE8089|nr:hypothetical protein [Virgibacillus doumboii]